jgi:thiol:disulfide interchange protein
MVAARQKASERKLPLFVDVYATWCGPCKMMDREVYPDPAVSAYMNKTFVNVRMDGETEYGSQFALEHGLQGYPSVFLFDAEGSHMSTLVGFMDAPELLEKLRSSVDN